MTYQVKLILIPHSQFGRFLGIVKNTLTKRLAELVEKDILQRVPSERRLKYTEYELTENGKDLDPVGMALAQRGDKWFANEDGPSFALLDYNSGNEVQRIWPDMSFSRPEGSWTI